MAVATFISHPKEAEGMIRWSLLFTLALENENLILLHTDSVSRDDIRKYLEDWAADFPTVKNVSVEGTGQGIDEDKLLDLLENRSASLLILGQNRFEESADEDLHMIRKIFDKAFCDSIILRLGNRRIDESDHVLVPTAGGPHSKIALQLASRLARRHDGEIVPLFIESEIGEEDGQAVGIRILESFIARAGLDRSDKQHIKPQIVVSNGVGKGIARAAGEKPYDLILLGASNSMVVKRKLFGILPERFFEGENAMTVALIRKRRPVSHRVQHRIEKFLSLKIPQLAREERIVLFERLQTQSVWSFDFVALILLSTGIASLGLVQSSPAVVIGAMLVAPLMTPLLGSGMSLVQGNFPLMRSCIKAIILGFLAALFFGTLVGFIAPITALTAELAARGAPTLLDFGVAALSGIAASYCIARPHLSSALAGVAIAAALVPPIATVGISMALHEWANASGAALLFGTNVVAIILASALTFFAIGIRGQMGGGVLWVRRTLIFLLFALGIFLIPLSTVLLSKAGKAAAAKRADTNTQNIVEATIGEILSRKGVNFGEIQISHLSRTDNSLQFRSRVESPVPVTPAQTYLIKEKLKKRLKLERVSAKILTELVVEGL
ncbi:MAG: DUF389 domain-containing protein [Verrucomicrobiales bacterium]|nr:DUF389 domain-containing protein [Verrucomicrobiales bacterium]